MAADLTYSPTMHGFEVRLNGVDIGFLDRDAFYANTPVRLNRAQLLALANKTKDVFQSPSTRRNAA